MTSPTTPKSKKLRIRTTLRILRKHFPEHGALDVGSDFHMLVAVVLSARTKDEQVLKALPRLFRAYPHAQALAQATPRAVEKYISSIGLYKSKAKHIVALAQRVCNEFGGSVPRTMHELVTLPGVGRKTASVLLASRYATPAIAVDTHVFRIARRLGWGSARSVAGMEKQLLRVVPTDVQTQVNTVMVPFGRAICTTIPRCWACPVATQCAYAHKNMARPPQADTLLAKAQAQRSEIARLHNDVSSSLPYA